MFENIEDYKSRIDDPNLDVDENSVLVLKDCGPVGYPGMPEVGNMALPRKLLSRGVRDMVRISDARMSGTAFGTCVLHVSPETAVGGPLALVQTGDWIELDGDARTLNVDLSDTELGARRETHKSKAAAAPERGYLRLHHEHVLQAHLGCDLDFLQGRSGSAVKRESH